MEEIKVGEYVRTNEGYIGKVSDVDDNFVFSENNIFEIEGKVSDVNDNFVFSENNIFKTKGKLEGYVLSADITKHSKNIIDLIEVGDYVNGEIITGVLFYENKKHIRNGTMPFGLDVTEDSQVKEILTHEQYQNNCYRLEN